MGPFKIDVDSPSTSYSLSGTLGSNNWYRSSVTVSLSASDSHSGVASTKYKIDGGGWQDYTGAFTVSGDGTHTVYYYSTDNAGNVEAQKSFSVKIDTTNPGKVSPSGPSGWTNDNTPTISWSNPGDTGSGVAGYEYAIDQTNTWTDLGNVLSFSTPALSDGTHTIYIRAYDQAGNRGDYGSVTVKIDTVKPVTTISPESSNIWHTTEQTVTLTASDSSGIAGTYYKIDGGAQQTYTGPFTLGDGAHTIEYWSVDIAGNEEDHKTATINIDTDGVPIIDIISPTSSNFIWGKPSGKIHVNYTYSEKNPASVVIEVFKGSTVIGSTTINSLTGGSVTRSDAVDISGADGTYDIKVTITDKPGNSNSDVETDAVKIDSTLPEISSVTIDRTLVKGGDLIRVNVTASDNIGLASVTADGIPLTLSGNVWTGSITAAETEGEHIITITATDYAGNQKIDTSKSYTVDNTPPSVLITSPANQSVLKGIVVINGSVTDLHLQTISVKIDGVEVSSSLPYSWNTSSESETTHIISVTGIDQAGNSNTKQIIVTVDRTDPTIVINSPTPASMVYEKPGGGVNITYTYTEANPDSVFIEIFNETKVIGNKTVTGLIGGTVTRTDYVKLDENIVNGSFNVKINISDKAGNNPAVDIQQNVIIIDSVAPEIVRILKPADSSKVKGLIEIKAEADDSLSGIEKVEFLVNDVSLANTTYPYSFEWDTTSMPDGNYYLKAKAYDRAGNVNTSAILITVDNTPPDVNLKVKPIIVGIGKTVNITASVDDANDVDTVLAEIRYPNGTIRKIKGENHNLYRFDFNDTSQYGKYEVRIIVNDTVGNVNDTEKAVFQVVEFYSNPMVNLSAKKRIIVNASRVDAIIEIFVNKNTSGYIDIIKSNETFIGTPNLSVPSPGKYIYINVSDSLKNSLVWAIIKFYYTDAEIAASGLDESSLSLYWLNESSSQWVKLSKGSPFWVNDVGVNTTDNFVWANVSHFSYYSIGGELYVPLPSPSTSGGGGGGGTLPCNTVEIPKILTEGSYTVTFDEVCVPDIASIEIFAATDQYYTKVSVETYEVKPRWVVFDDAPDRVYRYFRIKYSKPNTYIKKVKITFKVNETWLKDNSVDPASVAMYTLSESKEWEKLNTTILEKAENGTIYYIAETPRFSWFAVSVKRGKDIFAEEDKVKLALTLPEEKPAIALPETKPPATEATAKPIPELKPTPAPEEKPEKRGICGPTLILAILVLVVLLRRRLEGKVTV